MKADASSLLAIFEKKMRLEVPLFQRQYVWKREQQWEPLWEDIQRKFTEYLDGRKDAPVHFLGAMVLDLKMTPTTHVERRQVIDGQQRLTTLQIFLSAFRDFCAEQGCDELAKECEGFTRNRGMMNDAQVECFKVWPTQLDREQFKDVIECGSRAKLEEKHPLVRRKYARKPEPRPRMIEAYVFFHDQLASFFLGTNGELPLGGETELSARLEECFQALKNAFKVVIIDLDPGDDAQVIFETLNARGEPLLPADLLRNFIFLRAARQDENQETLYDNYWRRFDDSFWRQEILQGRNKRPRSDLFMQHFLSSRQCVDIPVKHLFVEYKHWIEKEQPFTSVKNELETIARQGDQFRDLLEPKPDSAFYSLLGMMEAFEIGTTFPFLLATLDRHQSDEEFKGIADVLESYLLRRAVCGMGTKNYNRIFLQLTKQFKERNLSPQELEKHLVGLKGESTEWPNDNVFETAWLESHAYRTMSNPRIVWILSRISDAMRTAKHERIEVRSLLTVEHLMPQSWMANYLLASGEKGLGEPELWNLEPNDPQREPSQLRHKLVQTMGNLTLVTQSLNSSVSNSAWKNKLPALLKSSLLPINSSLAGREKWDDQAITERGKETFALARRLWPRPT